MPSLTGSFYPSLSSLKTAVKLFSPNCLSHYHKAVFEIIHNAKILWVNGWREAFACSKKVLMGYQACPWACAVTCLPMQNLCILCFVEQNRLKPPCWRRGDLEGLSKHLKSFSYFCLSASSTPSTKIWDTLHSVSTSKLQMKYCTSAVRLKPLRKSKLYFAAQSLFIITSPDSHFPSLLAVGTGPSLYY